MKGKTNSALGGGGSGGGELIFAENALNKDSVEAGEKVLLRRFTATPEIKCYRTKSNNILCSPILKDRFIIYENTNEPQGLYTIEDDLTFKKITAFSHLISTSSSCYERALLFDNWLFYGNPSNLFYAVNLRTLDNPYFGYIKYSGCENFFFTTAYSAEIFNFNTQTGSMEKYFTVFQSIPYQYTYIPLLFYKDTVAVLYYYYNSNQRIYLYKLNHETQEKEELVYFEETNSKSINTDAALRFPLTPSCYFMQKQNGNNYVLKIDESGKTFYQGVLNCLGFEKEITAAGYNPLNRTFTIIKQEGPQTFLNILRFDPENWTKLEFVEKIDLTDTLENFRQSVGAESISVTKTQYVTEDLRRINLELRDKSSYYGVIINLKNNFTSWQAVPDFPYNYNESTVTALTTGKTDEHKKIEVKATLPEKISVTLNTNDVNATITAEGVKS